MTASLRGALRAVAAALLIGAVLACLWPLHEWASRIEPALMGIPFSIVWVFLAQAAVFTGLLLLFLTETD